ncbi:MAG: class I SAM-dependent rRNA methyltransferase [Phycisphaerae bacterium]|nr:class I SAM-dependent rRNA methyltransferase [Phycisphaerae bacterium]
MRLMDTALARRAELLADPRTNVGRLVNAAADNIDGLVIEKFGDVLVAQLHEGRLTVPAETAHELCAQAARRVQARAVYRKVFPKDRTTAQTGLERLHRDPKPWIGVPVEPELAVLENGITFLVHPYDGYATGLFLDHRVRRARVRELAADRRVLNAFAYTCGFTAAAALGGAASTVSVDVSKKYLEWGQRNLAANEIAPERHRFYCADIFDYYRRANRQGHRFDVIILDPPTFSRLRRPRRTFSLPADLEPLVRGALELLDPGGHLLLSVNHRGTSLQRLKSVVADTARAQRRACELLTPPPLPADFHDDQNYGKSVLAKVG